MTVHASVSRLASRTLTSARLRAWRRRAADWRRRASGSEATVHYFHQADDPYSQLVAQVLPVLRDRYRVALLQHAVPAPEAAAAPDPQRLRQWAARDAARLAAALGLGPPEAAALPGATASALSDGARLRRALGHYLGATLYFEGEWYWGIDRLHHLEQRLAGAGLARTAAIAAAGPLFPPPSPSLPPRERADGGSDLHFYCSLRSPYTYLAAARVRRLAEQHGARLHLRFVLPMVMRGLPVPWPKRLYILRDTKREAERLSLPFGCIVDPVGTPTERGLAVLHRAIALERGPAFLQSFLQGVFADGIDAGDERGLQRIAARAGLAAADVRAALADSSWRAQAEAHRADLLARGLWGVPSFRVDELPALWGQDRLFMVEQDLVGVRTPC
jgi:2-hydroxychromene-2-carboxylate isomerase